MSAVIRRYVPMAIFIICTIAIILDSFLNVPILGTSAKYAQEWGSILITFTLVVAFGTTARVHLKNLQKKGDPERYWSAYLLCLTFFTIFLGLVYGSQNPTYSWLYENVAAAVYRAMQGSVALYIASGAFRAFRLRSTEGSLLVIVIALVLLGGTTFVVAAIPALGTVANWLISVPTVGATRMWQVIVYLGVLGLIIRSMLGYEKGFFAEEKK